MQGELGQRLDRPGVAFIGLTATVLGGILKLSPGADIWLPLRFGAAFAKSGFAAKE